MLSSNLYFANSNNVSTSVSSVTPQTSLKGSETPSVKSIPDFTISLESFKENILQNLRNNIKEILDSEFTIFKSKCEELVQTSSVRYNKQIDHLQNELKTKDK